MPETKEIAVKKGQTSFIRAVIDTKTIDKANKEFDIVFATENPILRNYYWADEPFYEVLVCNPSNIRHERLDAGIVPLTDSHNIYTVTQQYGRIISWSAANGECRARVKYSTQANKADMWNDIENGIITGISVGPRIYKYERVPNNDPKQVPTYRAVDWEVMEIAMAVVPVDYKSAVRAEDGRKEFEIEIVNHKSENRSDMEKLVEQQIRDAVRAAGFDEAYANELIGRSEMTLEVAQKEINAKRAAAQPAPQTPVPAATGDNGDAAARAVADERERVAGINTVAAKYAGRLERSFIDNLIGKQANGGFLTVDQARMQILEKLAEGDANVGVGGGASVRGVDHRDTMTPMIDALTERCMPGSVERFKNLDPKTKGQGMSEAAREFRFMSMFDMVRTICTKNGVNVTGLSNDEVVKRAMATTDFTVLFTSTAQRFLRMDYEAVVPEWAPFSKRVQANDFRVKTGIKTDMAVTFEEIAENGEYKESTLMSNEKATIQLKTYGRKFSISRKTIINDDLGVLTRLSQMIALGYRQFQSKKVWGLVTSNALCPDGKALFHIDHKNLGTAAVIGDDSISELRTKMRRQVSPEGNELFLTPKYLLVPPELETRAQKQVSAILSATTKDVNIWGNLQPVVNPYFSNTLEWYLVADPAMTTCDGLVHAYLDGQEGLYVESYINQDNDALTIKARGDFDAAVWGHQGWTKNAGAEPNTQD